MLKGSSFSAIFMDLRMPIKDGIQATKECRALGVTTPIIAISAECGQETKDEARAAGVDCYIVKPMKFDQLLVELLKRFVRS